MKSISAVEKRRITFIIVTIIVIITLFSDYSFIYYNHTVSMRVSKRNCWQRLYEKDLRKEGPFELSRTTMCAVSPKNPEEYTTSAKKDFTILLIGVHLGPATDGKVNVPEAGYKLISWERRDHKYKQQMLNILIKAYDPNKVTLLQKQFWDSYKNDPALLQADAIECGFDTWHCLIFAPFNKKMIFNSVYRFSGHFVQKNDQFSAQLQDIFYKMVRNNPDVIMAGSNLYDVMFHQHFIGSHKLIPLPSVGEYTRMRALDEVAHGQCPGMRWNNESNTILIGGKRFSGGGQQVVNELLQKIQANKTVQQKYKFVTIKGHYKYCTFRMYRAVIFFPYSIHSYFAVELANLAVPVFVPSVKYMAKLEKTVHLLPERKSWLGHGKFEAMKQNTRSLNFGFDPNDDLDIPSLERWLYYSDFNYWEGTIFFDSLEDLFDKIITTDYVKAYNVFEKHRIKNKQINKENRQSLVRYLSDGPKSTMPKSFEEGMTIWNNKIKAPDFAKKAEHQDASNRTTNKWMIVNEAVFRDSTVISQIDPNCKVLFVASRNNETVIHNLTQMFQTHKLQVLTLEKQETLNYRIKQHAQLDKYGKGVLIGSLFLLSQGATSIQIPTVQTENTKGLTPFFFKGMYSRYILNNKPSDTNLRPRLPSTITYEYADFWAIVLSATSATRVFHQYCMSLWAQRLSWYLHGEPKKKLLSIRDSKLEKLSDKQKGILGELQAYLHYWKTESENESLSKTFFHIIDQLTFELAVQGFMRKSDAVTIRDYLLDLSSVGYSIPELTQ